MKVKIAVVVLGILIVLIPVLFKQYGQSEFENNGYIDQLVTAENSIDINGDYENSYEIFDDLNQQIISITKNKVRILDFNLSNRVEIAFDKKVDKITKIVTDTENKMILIYGLNDTSHKMVLVNTKERSVQEVLLDGIQLVEFVDSDSPDYIYLKYQVIDTGELYLGRLSGESNQIQPVKSLDWSNAYDYYVGESQILSIAIENDTYIIKSCNTAKRLFEVEKSYYYKQDEETFSERGLDNPFVIDRIGQNVYLRNPLSSGFGTIYRFNISDDSLTKVYSELPFEVNKIIEDDDGNLLLMENDGSGRYLVVGGYEGRLVDYLDNHDHIMVFSSSEDGSRHLVYKINFETEYDIRKYYIDFNTETYEQLYSVSKENYILKKEIDFGENLGHHLYGYRYINEHESSEPSPVIIMLHGGPGSRYDQSYYLDSQLFSRLGYEVIELNYRGSTGYGYDYYRSAGSNLPQAAIEDIGVVIDWIHNQQSIDENRIFVYGVSYGGYLALLSAIEKPDQILGTIAALPGNIHFMEQDIDNEQYEGVLKQSEKYSVRDRLFETEEIVGIVYNPYDPNLEVKVDWRAVAQLNMNVEILDQIDEGHTVPVESFKKVLRFIQEVTSNASSIK